MNDIVESGNQVPVSINCYFLWTSVETIIEAVQDGSDTDLALLLSFLSSVDMDDAGIGLIMDIEPEISITEETLFKSIGIGISTDIDIEKSALQTGLAKGVIHDIGASAGSQEEVFPVFIIDEFDPYNNLMISSIKNISEKPDDYTVNGKNQLMVEMEGYLVGTTIKTLVDQIDDFSYLAFLKIIQYFPHDICLYQMFEFDLDDKTAFTIPLIQVVPGKGDTYLGEMKRIRGWFNNADATDLLSEIQLDSIDQSELPVYFKEYLNLLIDGENVDKNLSVFLQDRFQEDLFESTQSLMEEIQTDIFNWIEVIELSVPDIDDLLDEDLRLDLTSFQSKIPNLNDMLNSTLTNISTMMYEINGNLDDAILLEGSLIDALDNNLSFDVIEGIIQNLNLELSNLDNCINALDTLQKEHQSTLKNLSDEMGKIMISANAIKNETESLYRKIADQLWNTFNTTKNQINIDNIMDKILDIPLPFPFSWYTGPFYTISNSIKNDIKDGIDISVSEFFDGSYSSFQEYVRDDPEFGFLDTLNWDVQNMTDDLYDLSNSTNDASANFILSMNSLLGQLRNCHTNFSNQMALMEDETQLNEQTKSNLLNLSDGLLTDLRSIENDLDTALTEVTECFSVMNEGFTNLSSSWIGLIDEMENDLGDNLQEIFENVTGKMLNDVTSIINDSFNAFHNDRNLFKSYFETLITQYANDLYFFTNPAFWNGVIGNYFVPVNGYVIVHSMENQSFIL